MQSVVIRAASLVAPREHRSDWLEEWQSELWYIRQSETTRFCLGAFQDALWLRRNDERPEQTTINLQSPVRCVAFLAALAAFSLLFAVWLPAPVGMRPYPHLRVRDLPLASMPVLQIAYLVLPVAVATGWVRARRFPTSWRSRLCRGLFLSLKFILVQPMMFCSSVLVLDFGRNPLSIAGLIATSFLVLRWIFADQRRRCPVCLQMLAKPVRIGTPSRTFLEWYGAESVCPRGHGMLHTAEDSAKDPRHVQWLFLDDSWSSLFSKPARARWR